MLVMQALYGLAMCTSKWSILWLLKHIFDIPWFRVSSTVLSPASIYS